MHCVVSLTLRNILLFAHRGTFASVCVCAVIMGFNIALSSGQTDNERKFWVILDQVGGKQDVFDTFLVGVSFRSGPRVSSLIIRRESLH